MDVNEMIELLQKVKSKNADIVVRCNYSEQSFYPHHVIVEHDMGTDNIKVVIEVSEN